MGVTIKDARGEEPRLIRRDVRRHKELTREALRDHLTDIIVNEEVISSRGDRVIRFPLPSIKEPQFRFGWAQQGTGQGGGVKRGQKVGQKGQLGQGQGQGQGQRGKGDQGQDAGDEPGQDMYDAEFTVDEIFDEIVKEIQLPRLEPKGQPKITRTTRRRPRGTQPKGPDMRLHGRATAKRHMKREIAQDNPEDEPFLEWDVRIKRISTRPLPESNAVVFIKRDTSGSMDQEKMFLSKILSWLLVQWVRRRYVQIDIVFIAHDEKAIEVPEKDFFTKVSSGGTHISSAYLLEAKIIKERYDPAVWNIYSVHCTDGDNSSSDNATAVAAAEEICKIAKLFAYAEIKTSSSFMQNLEGLKAHPQFAPVKFNERGDVGRAFLQILQAEENAESAAQGAV